MIIRLVHPGQAPKGPAEALATDYRKRLSRHLRVEELWLRPSRARDKEERLAEEAARIRAAVGPRDRLIVLDRGGAGLSSEGLAERLERWQLQRHVALNFALGSASGIDAQLKAQADERLSFGAMTLPHDLARVLFWEQMYRANAILRGDPYHK